jgi:hypothetical protein
MARHTDPTLIGPWGSTRTMLMLSIRFLIRVNANQKKQLPIKLSQVAVACQRFSQPAKLIKKRCLSDGCFSRTAIYAWFFLM